MNRRPVKYKMRWGRLHVGLRHGSCNTEACRNDFNHVCGVISLNLRLFSYQANAHNLKQGRKNLMCEGEPSKDSPPFFLFPNILSKFPSQGLFIIQ